MEKSPGIARMVNTNNGINKSSKSTHNPDNVTPKSNFPIENTITLDKMDTNTQTDLVEFEPTISCCCELKWGKCTFGREDPTYITTDKEYVDFSHQKKQFKSSQGPNWTQRHKPPKNGHCNDISKAAVIPDAYKEESPNENGKLFKNCANCQLWIREMMERTNAWNGMKRFYEREIDKLKNKISKLSELEQKDDLDLLPGSCQTKKPSKFAQNAKDGLLCLRHLKNNSTSIMDDTENKIDAQDLIKDKMCDGNQNAIHEKETGKQSTTTSSSRTQILPPSPRESPKRALVKPRTKDNAQKSMDIGDQIVPQTDRARDVLDGDLNHPKYNSSDRLNGNVISEKNNKGNNSKEKKDSGESNSVNGQVSGVQSQAEVKAAKLSSSKPLEVAPEIKGALPAKKQGSTENTRHRIRKDPSPKQKDCHSATVIEPKTHYHRKWMIATFGAVALLFILLCILEPGCFSSDFIKRIGVLFTPEFVHVCGPPPF